MYQLNLEHEFNAPVARLFAAWSQPEVLKQWFAPGTMTVPEAEADVRPGGSYRIVMQHDDGSLHIVGGQYHEVIENEKLVFSWQWQSSPNVTRVEVVFKALDESHSKVVLTHSEFVDQDTCDKHTEGWIGCLANLPRVES